MKLADVSKAEQRWHADACGTALAKESVGERWSLPIVRESMFGTRRFGQIRAGLEGISAKVLGAATGFAAMIYRGAPAAAVLTIGGDPALFALLRTPFPLPAEMGA